MPLILVIVADPHEAAQLATLIQGRLSVDLVQAAEVGEGLLALDDRIPDLILTSPLMSPFDDGVLDEYLRDLGHNGAHVQTLRIPVLSQASKKSKRLGFSLRRSKPEAPTTNGCDPKVFADEIEQYLARAAEEKGRVESNAQPIVVERQALAAEPEIAEEQWTPAYSEDEPIASASWSAPEPEAETAEWRADLVDRPPVEEQTPIAPESAPVAAEYEAVTSEDEQLSAAPVTTTWQEEVLAEPIAESAAEPEPPVEAIAEPEAPIETPIVTAPRMPAPPRPDEKTESPSFKAALAAIRAAWGKPSRQTGSRHPEPEAAAMAQPQPTIAATETPAAFEVDLTSAVDGDNGSIDVEPQAAATRVHASLDPASEDEVYELSVEPSAPAVRAVEEREAVESTPIPAADSNGESKKKGKRVAKGAKAKAQNEWGIFDPNQCGFAALVDKLDEVADEKTERRQNGGKARVISLS